MAAICSLAWCPDRAELRCFACPRSAPTLQEAEALIRRADILLKAWVEKYGDHIPAWLPPGGTVRWQEDAAAFIAKASA